MFNRKKFSNTNFTCDRIFYGEIEFNWNNAPTTNRGKIKRFVFKIQLSDSGENLFRGTIIKGVP